MMYSKRFRSQSPSPAENLRNFKSLTNFNDLPEEILEQIFCLLSVRQRVRIELVCKRWREIGKSCRWPTSIDVPRVRQAEFKDTIMTGQVMSKLFSRCGKSLRNLRISLREPDYTGNDILDTIGWNCPNLMEMEILFLSELGEKLSHMISFAEKCTKLKDVTLLHSDILDDDILVPFLRNCPSLEYLHLEDLTSITAECVEALNKKLKSLYMYECDLVDPDDFVEKLVNRCDGIEELGLDMAPSLPFPAFLKLVRAYKNTLWALRTEGNIMAQPCEWCLLPDFLPRIAMLSLNYAVGVDDSLMKLLAEKCRELFLIHVRGTLVTDVGVCAVASMRSLRVLDVSVTSVGLRILADEGRLEKFYVADMKDDKDLGLQAACILLAQNSHKLWFLDVSGNKNINPMIVSELRAVLRGCVLSPPFVLHATSTQVKSYLKCEHLEVVFRQDCDQLQVVIRSQE